jgi:aldehyde dehydrogenase (NAD+)
MELADISALFQAQRSNTAQRRHSFDLRARRAALTALSNAVVAHQSEIAAAIAADFGRPQIESIVVDVMPLVQEIGHSRRHLRKWMRARRVWPSLGMLGTSARVVREPRGTCLVIGAWNFPFLLTLGPLASALAAGNSVIVKPSELTPASSALMARMLADLFPPELVTVVEGGVETATALLALPFDHIFFTGSPAVGKVVMAAAAKTLASVALELGGKSPTILGPGANLAQAAKWVAWGKFVNTGQTCVAPDHVFAHESIAADFAEALKLEVVRLFGRDPASSSSFGRLVNGRNWRRVSGLLERAQAEGAEVALGGASDETARYLAPTILVKTTEAMAISQEEIFGPVLPVIPYADLAEVIARINRGEKPLTLYVFEKAHSFIDKVVAETSSGSVGVNMTVMPFIHPNLGFGGIGNSGQGSAHGLAGFRAFSHEKPVMRNHFSPLTLLFPPYGSRVRRLAQVLIALFR